MGICGSKTKNDNVQLVPPIVNVSSSLKPGDSTWIPPYDPMGFTIDHVDPTAYTKGPRQEAVPKEGWTIIDQLSTIEERPQTRLNDLRLAGHLSDIRQKNAVDNRPLNGPYEKNSDRQINVLSQFNSNNVPDGYGIMIKDKKEYYEGNFKQEIRSGYGAMIDNNGSFYVGYWENDLFSGQGKYLWSSGVDISGGWNKGAPCGKVLIVVGGRKMYQLQQDINNQWYGEMKVIQNNEKKQVFAQISKDLIEITILLPNKHFETEKYTNYK